jgi:hypothetical protein
VKALEQHSAFNIANPNNCYSLYLGFARSSVNFHAADGSGYQFIADAAIKVRHPLQTLRLPPCVLTSPAFLLLLLLPHLDPALWLRLWWLPGLASQAESAPHHHITIAPHHHITTSPHHHMLDAQWLSWLQTQVATATNGALAQARVRHDLQSQVHVPPMHTKLWMCPPFEPWHQFPPPPLHPPNS